MIMWSSISTLTTTTALILIIGRSVRATGWIDYHDASSNDLPEYGDDADQYLSALTRDEEQEIHSPIITGLKFVSGGAGEGRQHLSPSGQIPNRPEVKSDGEELPSYCDPPNPCPLDAEADDCDASVMSKFNAEYSRLYQTGQDCQCDNDHDQCSSQSISFTDPPQSPSMDILKRARRVRRNTPRRQHASNANKSHPNPYHKGQTLQFHVAKKSPVSMTA